MAASSSSSTRSWLEGTLDVISGMAPRPSTPVHGGGGSSSASVGGGGGTGGGGGGGGGPIPRSISTSSAPNSPARGSFLSNNNNNNDNAFPEILRLPSQDSVDRSIHNDNGSLHGSSQKTAPQMIRELRQSNARLTARTAALEADFMNQLNESTRQFETKLQQYQETCKETSRQLQKSEHKRKLAAQKLREQDDWMARLKEESAFHRHAISDLKSQLLAASNNSGNNNTKDNSQPTETSGTPSSDTVNELQAQVQALQAENQRLQQSTTTSQQQQQDPPSNGHNNNSTTTTNKDVLQHTQQALVRTEQALAELQTKALHSQSKHEQEVDALEHQVSELQQALTVAKQQQQQQEGESSNNNHNKDATTTVRGRTDKDEATIAELRAKVLQYSRELTAAETKCHEVQRQAAAQEVWYKEEADDLRVLNDAQEDEIRQLRSQVQTVQQELQQQQEQQKEEEETDKQELSRLQEELNQVQDQLQHAQTQVVASQERAAQAEAETEAAQERAAQAQAETVAAQERAAQAEADAAAALEKAASQEKEHANDTDNDDEDEEDELGPPTLKRGSLSQQQQQQHHHHQHEIQQLQIEVQELQQDLEQGRHEWNAQLTQKEAIVAELETRILQVSEERDELAEQVAHLQGQLDEPQHAAQAQPATRRRGLAGDDQDQDADDLLASKQVQLETLQAQLDQLATEKEHQTTELQDQLIAVEQDLVDTQQRWTEANRRLASLDLDHAQEVQDCQVQIQSLQQNKQALEQQIHDWQDRATYLEQQVVSLEQQKQQQQQQHLQASMDQEEPFDNPQPSRQQPEEEKSNKENALAVVDSQYLPSKEEQEKQQEELESLRIVVAELAHSEATLKELCTAAHADKERDTNELKEKLQDRDTTISALVKSSVTMEQQIASMQIEMDLLQARLSKASHGTTEEGVDVILAKGEDLGKLKSSLDAYKETETRLSNEVFRLKRQLHHAKLENGRLRQRMNEVRSTNNANNTSGDGDDASTVGGQSMGGNSSIVPVQQLKDRDDAIAKLARQSVEQEECIADLKRQLEEQQQQAAAAINRSQSADEMELEELRQETEMFAGQVIEQDEEIEKLKRKLAEKEGRLGNVEQEAESQRRAAQSALDRTIQAEEAMTALELKVHELTESLQQQQQQSQGTTSSEAQQPQPSASSQDSDAMQRVYSLEAELDELREANAEQMKELRILRRTAHDAGMAADQLTHAQRETAKAQEVADHASNRVRELQQELDRLKSQLPGQPMEGLAASSAQPGEEHVKLQQERLENLQMEIVERDRMIQDLKHALADNKSMSGDELELRDEIDSLQRNLANQSTALDEAKNTIRELERMAAERTEHEHARFEEEKEELMAEVEHLTQQLDEAQKTIDQLRKDEEIIQEFKAKLEQADEDREVSERTIIDNYERKLSLLTLDKDVLVDKLRTELQAAKEGGAKVEEESSTQITTLENQIKELEGHAQSEIQQRDTHILQLEHTVQASQQLIENMRTEMDHLQGSMVNATAGRREEIEDMQQELVALTATAAGQERELNTLRQELHDKEVAHTSQVQKLQETIELLESQTSSEDQHRNAHDLAMEIKIQEIKDRMEKLKWRNSTLQEENTELKDRLEKSTPGGVNSIATENELAAAQEKIAALQLKVAEQSKRIQNLEAKLEKARAASLEPPPPPPPPMPTSAPPVPIATPSPRSGRSGFFGRRKSDPVS